MHYNVFIVIPFVGMERIAGDRAVPPRCFATGLEKAAGAVGDPRCFPGDRGILWELDKLGEIRWKYDGNTMEIRWKYDGNTMEIP